MKKNELKKVKTLLKQLQSDNVENIINTKIEDEDEKNLSCEGFVDLLEINNIYFIQITLNELIEISKNDFNIKIKCNLKDYLSYDNLVWTNKELEAAAEITRLELF